jgi:isopentenyl diphosphate isomerase/L-lactate dehydrogenase-like FMN-dependent dehydrogenase
LVKHGVRQVLEGITEELQMIMNVTGTARCDAFDADVIWR